MAEVVMVIGMCSGTRLRVKVKDGKTLVDQVIRSLELGASSQSAWHADSGVVLLNLREVEFILPETALVKEGEHGQV